jgi:hypothetical protein
MYTIYHIIKLQYVHYTLYIQRPAVSVGLYSRLCRNLRIPVKRNFGHLCNCAPDRRKIKLHVFPMNGLSLHNYTYFWIPVLLTGNCLFSDNLVMYNTSLRFLINFCWPLPAHTHTQNVLSTPFQDIAYVHMAPLRRHKWRRLETECDIHRPTRFVRNVVLCHEISHSLYTYSQQVLRNVGSKSNREVPVLFTRYRLRAMKCCRLELKIFFSLWGLWLVFVCYQIVSLKDAVHHRRKGRVNLCFTPFCPSIICPERLKRQDQRFWDLVHIINEILRWIINGNYISF